MPSLHQILIKTNEQSQSILRGEGRLLCIHVQPSIEYLQVSPLCEAPHKRNRVDHH
jgi:hypothetical protein